MAYVKTESHYKEKHMEKYNREEFEEVIVNIGRVTKVVKGGRRFRFTALIVVGNSWFWLW